MDPIARALLAVDAALAGEAERAAEHLAAARRAISSPTSGGRRARQVVEIAATVVAGRRVRAAGLALVHAAEFPDDADRLAAVVATGS